MYNLRIVPAEPVFSDVADFKTQFENKFGKQPLSRSKPHITIVSFRMNSKHQDLLVAVFQKLSRIEKFKLAIPGFDIFEKNSRALHLKVPKTESVEGLHKTVQSLCDNHLGGKVKLLKISNVPHMTISKTNGKKMLYKSFEFFQKTRYSGDIEVTHLTLVSRSRYKPWQHVHEIKLS